MAGYAFSIWGIIYAFGCSWMIYQVLPARWEWVNHVVGFKMVWNLAANSLWLFAFGNEWGRLWVSVVVIFGGILLPLTLLHHDMRIAYGPDTHASISEALFGNVFVSLYLGWTCVACIANVAVALTPGDEYATLGLGAAVWSIVMQLVALAIGVWFCVVKRYALNRCGCGIVSASPRLGVCFAMCCLSFAVCRVSFVVCRVSCVVCYVPCVVCRVRCVRVCRHGTAHPARPSVCIICVCVVWA